MRKGKFSLFFILGLLMSFTAPQLFAADADTTAPAATDNSSDDAGSFALLGSGGTPGIGAGIIYTVTPKFNLTAKADYFKHNFNMTHLDANYKATATLRNASALASYYPWGETFHLTGGGFYNDNNLTASFADNANHQICFQGSCYNSSQLSSVTGKVTFNKIAPYAGIGWGASPQNSGLGMDLNLGAFYQGTPKITYDLTGSDATNQTVINQMNAEVAYLHSKIDRFRFYPVVDLALYYRF